MVRQPLALIFTILTFSAVSYSATVTPLGPVRINSGTFKNATYNYSFSGYQQQNSVLIIKNGTGSDLSLQTCAGKTLERLLCQVQNLLIQAQQALERPSVVEFTLNGKTIVTQASLPQSKGSLQISVTLLPKNDLQIKLGNIPTQYLTFQIQSDLISQNQLPIASFVATPNKGIAPEAITFNTMLSRDPDGSIVDYSWDFGDGTLGSGFLVTHNYLSAGTFTAKVTVTDNQGGKASSAQMIVISKNQLPIADFKTAVDRSTGDLQINFDASTSSDPDGSITQYEWKFGDGTTATGKLTTHRFATDGNFQVTLAVTDNKGASQIMTKTVSFDTTPPTIVISGLVTPTKDTAANILTQVSDFSLASSDVFLNGNQVGAGLVSPASISLSLVEGMNTIKVVATDAFGNVGTATATLTLDRTPPVLSSALPANNTLLPTTHVVVSGTSNEPLARALVNGKEANISPDKLQFSYEMDLPGEGSFAVPVALFDALENSSVTILNLSVKIPIAANWDYQECPVSQGVSQ